MQNNAPWVVTESVDAPLAWRCTKVYLLSPEENGGKHNIFIDALISGIAIRNGSILAKWGWEGQHDDEYAKPAILDKRAPDHCTDIPIEKGQHIWCKLLDPSGHPSDIVRHLHAEIAGSGNGNDWHHWSYWLVFELLAGQVIAPPPVIVVPGLSLESLDVRMKKLEAMLHV